MSFLRANQETFLHIGMLMVIVFFASIWIRMKILVTMEQRELEEKTGIHTYFTQNLREKILNMEWYQEREENIRDKTSRLFPLGVPEEYTPEAILAMQAKLAMITIGATFVLFIITKIIILPIVGIALTVFAITEKDRQLTSKLQEKEEDFDTQLPQFENSLLMGINAGATLTKAMELAIDSMMDSPSKEEFELLLTQTRTSTSDPSFPYLELAKRVHTKDCDQFTNLIINGVRNGTSMGTILEGNSATMMENMKNRIHEQNEKASTRATVFTSGFVLLPMVVIFIAPMVANSGM